MSHSLEPAHSEQVSPTPGRAAFIFIFFTVMLDMLAIGVMVPVLPKLVAQFEGGDIASAAKVTGVFGFIWAAMQFIFSPLLGALSDRFGRRPIVLLSNFGLGADYVLMALAPSLTWLFIGRVISGITSASFPTAAAYISDVTPSEKRAAQFGMLGAAFGLGFIIGPAVGGYLGSIDLRLPFWVAAGLSLANAAYGFFILPESLPPERRSPLQWKLANPLGSMKLLRSHPVLFGLSVAIFLQFLAHESLPSIFVLYADYRYGWTEQHVGYALAIIGVMTTIVSAVLVGPTVKKLGERRTALIGFLFGAVGFFVFAVAPTGLIFVLGIIPDALWGLSGPPMQAMMSRHIGPSEQGQLQGAFSSLRGITGMIGPILFTQAFAALIKEKGALHLPGAPFMLASVLILGCLVLAWRATAGQQVTSEVGALEPHA